MKRILLILAIITTGTFYTQAQADFTFNETQPLGLSSDEAFVSVPLEVVENVSEEAAPARKLSEEEKRSIALASMRHSTKPMLFFSSEQVKLKLWSPSEAAATVKIHTENGKLVKVVDNYTINSGNNEMIIPVKELKAGSYWISFFKNGELISSRSYTKL
ncbi:MAG: hypothetical protein MI974_14225 [Chitinophagales bacterium]|nr:hypothetical protein [Chitinophagales bacterium]